MSFLGFRLGLTKDNIEVLLLFYPFAHQRYRELVVTIANLSNQIDQLELAKEREIFFELLGSLTSSTRTVNSSPPILAIVQSLRIHARSRSLTSLIRASPVAWP